MLRGGGDRAAQCIDGAEAFEMTMEEETRSRSIAHFPGGTFRDGLTFGRYFTKYSENLACSHACGETCMDSNYFRSRIAV